MSALGRPSPNPLASVVELAYQAGLGLVNLVYALSKPEILRQPEFMAIYRRVYPLTMTSIEAVYALYRGVEHIVGQGIPGDFVECGVWRGGSSMAMALTLLKNRVCDRDLMLYDTYEGMTAPTAEDGPTPIPWWQDYFEAPLETVMENLFSTGYPQERMKFVKGPVQETLPEVVPESIALLRLDTDWYESTRLELEHLFPRLSPGGILLIDDYGAFRGCRQAVDEYFARQRVPMYLHRVDLTVRMGIKLG